MPLFHTISGECANLRGSVMWCSVNDTLNAGQIVRNGLRLACLPNHYCAVFTVRIAFTYKVRNNAPALVRVKYIPMLKDDRAAKDIRE